MAKKSTHQPEAVAEKPVEKTSMEQHAEMLRARKKTAEIHLACSEDDLYREMQDRGFLNLAENILTLTEWAKGMTEAGYNVREVDPFKHINYKHWHVPYSNEQGKTENGAKHIVQGQRLEKFSALALKESLEEIQQYLEAAQKLQQVLRDVYAQKGKITSEQHQILSDTIHIFCGDGNHTNYNYLEVNLPDRSEEKEDRGRLRGSISHSAYEMRGSVNYQYEEQQTLRNQIGYCNMWLNFYKGINEKTAKAEDFLPQEKWQNLAVFLHKMNGEEKGKHGEDIGTVRILFSGKNKDGTVSPHSFGNQPEYKLATVQPPFGANMLESLLNPEVWVGREADALKLIQMLPKEAPIDPGITAQLQRTHASNTSVDLPDLSGRAAAAEREDKPKRRGKE